MLHDGLSCFMLDGRWLAAGDRWSKLQWSAVVAAGCAVVESQGSTLDASRMVVEEIVTESDRMEPNKKVTVATVTFRLLWTWGSQMPQRE